MGTDVRWNVIAGAVDCRTRAELGEDQDQKPDPTMAGDGVRQIPKSRYSTISKYICNCKSGLNPHTGTAKYNDTDVPIDEEVYQMCKASGLDELLCQHIAHLFIRDPMICFKERIELDDSRDTDHFENIQSTNWNTVRFKAPP